MWENILYTSIALIIIIVLIGVVIYLVNMKNLKKQKEHFKDVHQNIQVGAKVEVLNGIYGKVSGINEETIDLKVKSKQYLLLHLMVSIFYISFLNVLLILNLVYILLDIYLLSDLNQN